MGCLWIIKSLKQIVVTGFAFNCNAVMAKLRIEIKREANCDKQGISPLLGQCREQGRQQR